MSVDAQERRRRRITGRIDPKAWGYFDPLTIDGLELWLDADQITGLNDGDPVSLWEDESGNDNDAVQGVAAYKPTYETNELNGKPVVRFDGSDEMYMNGLSVDSIGTLIFVLVPTPASPVGFFDSAPNQSLVIRNYSAGNFYWWNLGGALGMSATTPVIAYFTYTPSPAQNLVYYRDNSLIWDNDGTDASAKWLNPRIGSINVGAAGYYTGDIAEIIFYDTVLSATDRERVHIYLNDKYNIY